jgi:hypothetical protein
MANVILRMYIPRKAEAEVRSWRQLGRKKALSRYLLEKAQEAAIGEVELSQVMAGYIGGDDRHSPTRSRDIPDCLDICGRASNQRQPHTVATRPGKVYPAPFPSLRLFQCSLSCWNVSPHASNRSVLAALARTRGPR